ncbi:MAG: glycoside hydrolase family 1 protein [Candidatus Dormibacteraeota bacterium]|nr:glycoside hydrolase family 1 protein [Candidatus Dormibacteraeota bacterium]
MTSRRLPPDFLIGCATAAHQVEGGIDNDWSAFERQVPSPIAAGGRTTRAIDHHSRYREDLAQLAAAAQNAHRFSIEWARVEPSPGVFDRAALDHYGDVVRVCRDVGLEPVVTLQHFTLPRWLAERGGIRAPDAPALFARYAALCADVIGAQVRWWVTINEPAVLAVQGYLDGQWPPAQQSLTQMFQAFGGLLRMHAAGALAVHRTATQRGGEALVSVAHHERRQRPLRDSNLLDRAAAAFPDFLFNRWFLRSCLSGRMLPPVGLGERVAGLDGSLDYLGVNYYTEDVISFDPALPGMLFAHRDNDPALPHSSFEWAINPAGLRRALLALWHETRLPLLITENGVADEHDELRAAYVVDHLNAVLDAVDAGADVRGYLHWTAWDNFEWAEGYTKKFGFWSVDRETMARHPKPSSALYEEICRSGVVPARAPDWLTASTIERAGAR